MGLQYGTQVSGYPKHYPITWKYPFVPVYKSVPKLCSFNLWNTITTNAFPKHDYIVIVK